MDGVAPGDVAELGILDIKGIHPGPLFILLLEAFDAQAEADAPEVQTQATKRLASVQGGTL